MMIRRFAPVLAWAILGGLLAACSSSGGAFNPPPSGPHISSTITSGITANAGLYGAVTGPDGRVWFAEFSGDNLAAVTTSGTVTEYPTGASTQPCAITVGPDNNLWTGGYGASIEKVTTAGVVTTYAVAGAHVCGIISGPGGLLWFADYGNNKVGTITTSGVVTEYAMPAGSQPDDIALGSDGNLWVTDDTTHSIIKVSPAGVVLNQYSTGISSGEQPNYIAAAPDGNLYFTEDAFSSSIHDKIGRITTGGTITEIGTLSPNSYLNVITIGKDGNAYFTEYSTAKLGKVTIATGHVSETSPGLAPHGNQAITAGPDGRLWIGGKQTIWALTY